MDIMKITAIAADGGEKVFEVQYPTKSTEVIERHRLGYLKENAAINKLLQDEKPDEVALQHHSIEAVREICPIVLDIRWPNAWTCFEAITMLRQKLAEAFKNFSPPKISSSYSFEHNGHIYRIDKFRAKSALGASVLRTYESIEYLEMQRVYQAELDAYEKEHKEFNFDKQYIIGTQSVALLCRRDGEPLPRTPEEIRTWTAKRCAELADLSTYVHQAVTFFLLRISIEYGLIQNTNMHSRVSRKLASGKNRRSKYRRTRKQKQSAKT